ncbi:MAG: ribonuclease R [Rhodospirillales bacterium]|nr:ribonuclease R [Rhodospirillales bacterium]MCB9996747.1 ribonuclease R [Rhodospirillales bacterium]
MPCPTREDILNYLSESATPLTKRELGRAFGIKGDERIPFKKALRSLETDGLVVKQAGGGYAVPDALPAVTIIEVTDIDVDGDVLARPAEWDTELQGDLPRIEIKPDKKGHPSLSIGDRVLARLDREPEENSYTARVIRRLDTPKGRVMGVIRRQKKGFVLQPADKKARYDFEIAQADLGDAQEGDLAIGEIQPGRGMRTKKVRIVEVIGHRSDPKAISLISAHEMGLREEFPSAVIAATETMEVPDLKGREDLRDIPLVTIDGADARDFDDAVFAEETEDGFHLMVAIADVAYYVKAGSALDNEAYARGNSTYFPDRVIPMLPEKLSNDLCSLRPKENRACMAVHLWINRDGRLKDFKFVRGLMRSAARLTYEQVQAAMDGLSDDTTGPLLEPVIKPLYKAYAVLWQAREERGALDLDLPERQILVNDKGEMTGVKLRGRLDSHKLIEEFMILANVAAASALEAKKAPCVYRIHDKPNPAKLDSVREFISGLGLSLPKGQVIRPAQINQLLHKAEELPYSHLVSQVVLRAQAQAIYHPENIGHFGLALHKYAHFTSPIRRYADLLVHRSLIRSYKLGPGGLSDEEAVTLEEKAQHISQTERWSMEAERNSIDRFTAAYLSEKVGAIFDGRITGVSRFGLFVALADTGADGLVPIRTLPDDYYIHDEQQHALIGRSKGRVYRMGAHVQVQLKEADGLTGSTILALASDESADIPGLTLKPPQGASGHPGPRRNGPPRKKKGFRGKRRK